MHVVSHAETAHCVGRNAIRDRHSGGIEYRVFRIQHRKQRLAGPANEYGNRFPLALK